MRNESEANHAIDVYADMVRRICFMHLKNHNDVEDIFQDVFLKYILNENKFESDAHEKAWFIRVTINACKDSLKSFFKRKVSFLHDLNTEPFYIQEEDRNVLNSVLKLPEKYKNVVYLFYYEGYSAVEIAEILHKSENTVYTWLSRARQKLKDALGGESFDQ